MINDGAEELRDDIAAIEVAMLTLSDEQGHLNSYPMYTLQLDRDGVLWFFIRQSTFQSSKTEYVNLSYADPGSHTYLSISGSAICREDPELKRKFWSPLYETWFPMGVDHTDLCLLAVKIEKADIWDPETAAMKNLINIKR
ncbi:putative general stress protein 26 [Fulvivirga imtechensis AK7]|uniref:Putative general stress protein 26 n=1 Tax=Fulvivirga imtechensis AK7 TaxID=1237149 RepID=L8K170_9BACT|nr:pyridoxamine 5'-phosphate oxidase family protein [Fulvivirga imtechensis]ELR73197.1 putative general stress protein 26 [Fulvivirga imtechensis AK7]